MDASAAQNQIKQMISFILSEANDKAAEIQKKGDEEFSIEVHRMITEQKEKMRQTYERKVKQIETQYAIAKSTAINKQRLEKIKARQDVMMKIADDVKAKLAQEMKSEGQAKPFVTKLIVQGLLMLLENEVSIRCREADVKMVEACLSDAASQYSQLIKSKAGASKSVKLSLDKTAYLPKDCLGGVILQCADGKITIDNTIDVRLKLVMEQDKPAIRGLLFPQAKK
eukprot:TRINITY_DN2823_c0_g1_i3.p1 TRINITY_DN2823_c0_g1~~TRINITY_DN2823_c0_g1_i3.p1  ORF type:complete len:226 (+),score=93.32 TRINITY_DN2823_c0_g1_i3:93-770(+)